MSATVPVPVPAAWFKGKLGDRWPCFICGRPIGDDRQARMIEVVAGGSRIAVPGEADQNDPGYMGYNPIGSECAKRIPTKYVSRA